MTEISREEILRRFEVWLDSALTAEEPPRGIDAEILDALTGDGQAAEGLASNQYRPAPASEYSLWAAMTALTQEVKLQGRSFKELSTAVSSQTSLSPERERDLVRDTEHRCRKEILGVLIDLRDRLKRGLESVRASESQAPQVAARPTPSPAPSPARRGFLARVFSRSGDSRSGESPSGEPSPPEVPADTRLDAIIPALRKGYEMGLDRLDQTLEEFNAREIPCQGQPFDPRRMNAIDRQESDSVPDGTVIEVYRSGYEWNGDVFRPAQVKVAFANLEMKPGKETR